MRSKEMISEQTVKIDNDFYEHNIKPYSGCSRGAQGTPAIISLKEWILEQKRNVLVGTDEEFICIPRKLYEKLLDLFDMEK